MMRGGSLKKKKRPIILWPLNHWIESRMKFQHIRDELVHSSTFGHVWEKRKLKKQ